MLFVYLSISMEVLLQCFNKEKQTVNIIMHKMMNLLGESPHNIVQTSIELRLCFVNLSLQDQASLSLHYYGDAMRIVIQTIFRVKA